MTPGKPLTNEPVDAVYTWTGGDELRYSLRSIERYAPWIRKVYVVTDGKAPAWLAVNHPRLGAVRHEDIFRDRSALPTSNPDAIAWQLFRIPGLSRQFLYLDPNFVLRKPLRREDFLSARGGYRFLVDDGEVAPDSSAAKLLNSRFGARTGRKLPGRIPRLLDKSFLEEVHRLWEKQIKQTTAHQTPQPDDVSMEALYFYYLVECPQQYGVHEQARVPSGMVKSAGFSDAGQLWTVLMSGPQCVRLEAGSPGALSRLVLKIFYWKRSPLEV